MPVEPTEVQRAEAIETIGRAVDAAKPNVSKGLLLLHWCVQRALTDAIATLIAERDGYMRHLRECEQIAGKALRYPWYKDHQQNFPGATEADGVCVGEHVGDSIVEELANRLKTVEAQRDAARAAHERLRGAVEPYVIGSRDHTIQWCMICKSRHSHAPDCPLTPLELKP